MRRVRHGNTGYRSIRPHQPRHAGRRPLSDGLRRLFSERPKKGLMLAVLAVAAAAAGWYLIWSPAFRIGEIDVRGASAETEQVIRSLVEKRLARRRFLLLPQSCIFVFDRAGMIKDVNKELFLDEFDLSQKLPDRLDIDIKERSLRAVLLTDKRFWALDESGIILRELSVREIESLGDLPPNIGSASVPELGAESMDVQPVETAEDKRAAAAAVVPFKNNANKFPLIIDRSGNGSAIRDRLPGDTAFPQTVMTLILQANVRLPDLSGTRVRWFGVRDTAETVEATMDGDWLIYLTTLLPFDVQGTRLALVLKERIGSKKDALEYIDLRYNERIFFRFK